VGGLHGLAATPATSRAIRGKNLHGQYYEANPGHAAELDRGVDAEIGKRWRDFAIALKIRADRLPPVNGETTRGQFIEAAFREGTRGLGN
jgi:hypothetical protein